MAVLTMRNVTRVFGEGEAATRALDGVDIDVESREVVAIMGPSGAGKTTLLTIAGALQRPTSGEVTLDGERIDQLPERALSQIRRHKVGFIFQSYNLLQALTAVDNVRLVLELNGIRGRQATDRARMLLEMFGLGKRANELPRRMSGGEQQRVAVARAFATDASLILADEPTANLDQQRAEDLMQLLRATSRDLARPILMVTHDLRTHHLADRVLWLEGGKLRRIQSADVGIEAGRPASAAPAGGC